MSSMHPHWQSTGAPQKNVTVPTADGVAKPNDWKPASRRPAALVGIGLVVTILFAFVHGVEYLQGQLLSEVTITIQEDGTVTPQSISADRGSVIVWTNNSLSLAIIGSETLCGDDGECMYIPVLPFSSERYRIPVSALVQTHSFYQNTPDTILGEIIVTGTEPQQFEEPAVEVPVPTPITEPVQEPTAPTVPDTVVPDPLDEPQEIVSPQTTPQTTPIVNDSALDDNNEEPLPIFREEELFPVNEEVSSLPPLTAELPRNPYTVGSNFNPPSSPIGGSPPTELHGGAPLPPIRQHKPIRQPETGMGTWIVITLAVMGGAILLRRSRTTMLITEPRR